MMDLDPPFRFVEAWTAERAVIVAMSRDVDDECMFCSSYTVVARLLTPWVRYCLTCWCEWEDCR